ncbi:hypothetical protein BRADI_1g60316v3 [Brachypodium distachyon]|uniref:Uncharacterized protein n=1 Tax=Brachypodium distachyon TaxID=15368 RepID=A0A0Q3JV61_BRADI|nr:hypothetical protein BRADI_1g60316v3 [Brachypodium distachyon]
MHVQWRKTVEEVSARRKPRKKGRSGPVFSRAAGEEGTCSQFCVARMALSRSSRQAEFLYSAKLPALKAIVLLYFDGSQNCVLRLRNREGNLLGHGQIVYA